MSVENEIGPILADIAGTESRIFLQFGGQGNSYMMEMRRLYKTYPAELGDFFQACFEAINEIMAWDEVRSSDTLKHGFALEKWLKEEEVPPQEYLLSCTISLPCTEVTQLAYFNMLIRKGYPQKELMKHVSGLTGHSQGVLAAVLTSMELEGAEYRQALKHHIQFLIMGGFRCQETFPIPELSQAVLDRSQELDMEPPTPMVAISGGITRDDLQKLLDDFNSSIPEQFTVTISLYNLPDMMVLSGRQDDLVEFRARNKEFFDENEYKWGYLEITAPFHSHILTTGVEKFRGDLKRMGYDYRGSNLKYPVYSTHDGKNMQEMDELGPFLFLLQAATSLDWPLTLAEALKDPTVKYILDFGPGRSSELFAKKLFEGKGVTVLTTANRKMLRKILETL